MTAKRSRRGIPELLRLILTKQEPVFGKMVLQNISNVEKLQKEEMCSCN
jgi:hypothetical protein